MSNKLKETVKYCEHELTINLMVSAVGSKLMSLEKGYNKTVAESAISDLETVYKMREESLVLLRDMINEIKELKKVAESGEVEGANV